jgi:solute:Na+ symporter, SSS family
LILRVEGFLRLSSGRAFCYSAVDAFKPFAAATMNWGFVFTAVLTAVFSPNVSANVELRWQELPSLPPASGAKVQQGVAGPFVGSHGGALIVAGGANFPVAPPWKGGVKAWYDQIWVMIKGDDGTPRWITDANAKLPRPMGYGIAFSTGFGVICLGGSDATQCFSDGFVLRWNARNHALERDPFPSLPTTLALAGGARIGSRLFVVAGQVSVQNAAYTSDVWSIDLARRGSRDFLWKKHASIPGAARMLPVVESQSDGTRTWLYVFSGRLPRVDAPAQLLTDAFRYDADRDRWEQLDDIRIPGERDAACLMGGIPMAFGERTILVFGGDRGTIFRELEAHDLGIASLRAQLTAANQKTRSALSIAIADRVRAKEEIYAAHPGFSNGVLAYDTIDRTWRKVGTIPGLPPVTTSIVPWNGAWVIPSGEDRPGIRSPRTLQVRIQPR